MEADYADDVALLANTPAQAKTLLHSLERTSADIDLIVNADMTEYRCFNQRGDVSTQNSETSKQVQLSRKQCLMNINWHQYVTSKDMDKCR